MLVKGDWARSLTCCLGSVTRWAKKNHLFHYILLLKINIFSSSTISTNFNISRSRINKTHKTKLNLQKKIRRRRGMNGEESFVEDCSEYVEIDPSGRYGRVWFFWTQNVLSLFVSILILFLFVFGMDSTMKYLAKVLRRQCNLIHLHSLSFLTSQLF